MSAYEESSRVNLRARMLSDILNSLSSRRNASAQSREHLASIIRELTIGTLTSPSFGDTSGMENATALVGKGGITETDIRRFTSPFTPKLEASIQNLISEELESAIVSMSDFFSCPGSDEGQTLPSPWNLHSDIQAQLGRIEASNQAGDHAHDRIEQLTREIHQIHPRLQQRLAFAVTKFPREIATRNSANNDLLAMTIEALLVKVSLIRAQALNTVYDYRSPKKPELQMTAALAAAYAKLKEDEREMEEEERRLDRELAEYQTLLDMVDGGGSGGFRQIVADCARVEKETEECRKDLRRLGWTGGN